MRFLITAGPTREPVDAVRFLSNRSSGAMGVAVANAAAAVPAALPGAGHEVTLLLGPVDWAAVAGVSEGVRVERFETTADLEALLDKRFADCDVLVMAAAVADYRPVEVGVGKRERAGAMTLSLEATPDLVAGCAMRKRADQRVVAFALEEPAKLEERAAAKLKRKRVDAIVANTLRTMDAAEIDAVWLTAAGVREASGIMSKRDFAAWLVARVAGLV